MGRSCSFGTLIVLGKLDLAEEKCTGADRTERCPAIEDSVGVARPLFSFQQHRSGSVPLPIVASGTGAPNGFVESIPREVVKPSMWRETPVSEKWPQKLLAARQSSE